MHLKRITALLCSLTLAASGASALPAVAEERITLYVSPRTATPCISETAVTYDVPEAFDLRSKGLVTPVKDQNPYGTCWIFGTMSSLESNEVARDPHVDFSEWYMAHYAFRGPLNDPTVEDNYLDNGGSTEALYGMMTNWIGPVPEALCPYGGENPDFDRTLADLQQEAAFHVTDSHIYDLYGNYAFDEDYRKEFRQHLKQFIYEGHVLYFNIGSAMFSYDVYNEKNYSYYAPTDYLSTLDPDEQDMIMGHAMSIVGWDDNFPATAFTYQPPHDGAWLVKNSWGTGWGDDGYFWLSYEDYSFGTAAYYDMDPAGRRDTLFAYDDYSCGGAISLGIYGDTEAYAANCFTAQDDTWITEVMINCVSNDDDCEITLYTGLTEASPISGTPSAVTRTKLTHVGYQTVPLAEPVFVPAGERFSVTVHFSGDQFFHIPCEVAVADANTPVGFSPTMLPSLTQNTNSREALERDYHENESFFSADGKQWEDMYTNRVQADDYGDDLFVGNIGIKAVGVKGGFVEFSDYHETLPAGTQLALSTLEDAPIYYALNGGEYQLYESPIAYDGGKLTVSAYADTGDKKVFTRTYTQQKAELTTLKLINADVKSILDTNSTEFELYYSATTPKLTYFVPTATGTITIDGVEVPSNERFSPDQSEAEREVTITVAKEGLLPTTYTVKMTRGEGEPVLRNGVWISCISDEDDTQTFAYEFWNGKGQCKNLETGRIEQFTYEMLPEQIVRLCYEDRTEELPYKYEEYDFEGNMNYSFMLYREDGSTQTLLFSSPRTHEECAFFCRDEIIEAIKGVYEYETGKKPTKVVYSEIYNIEVYEGKTLSRTYGADYQGFLWRTDTEGTEDTLYKTGTGDINHDQVVNATDAALILAEAAAVGAGGAGSFGYAQKNAGDVNGDGDVNASDAANVLTYAAAVGAGDQEIRLSSFRRS